MLRKSLFALVAATAMLTLAGCSSPAAPGHGSLFGPGGPGSKSSSSAKPRAKPTTAAVVDPCKLLTKDEAQAIVATTLSDGVNSNPSEPSCLYAPDPNAQTAQVEIHVGAGAKQAYDTDKRIGHTFTDVDGLGDESHLEDYAIFFRHGSTWVSISTLDLVHDGPTAGQLLIVGAKAVDARL